MLVQKLISMLQPKKKALRKPSVSNIKTNFACSDATLEWHIKAFLSNESTAKDCLQALLEHMAYDHDRRIKENEIIFDMLRNKDSRCHSLDMYTLMIANLEYYPFFDYKLACERNREDQSK